jgi:hypothetical protein
MSVLDLQGMQFEETRWDKSGHPHGGHGGGGGDGGDGGFHSSYSVLACASVLC